jgi:hypothetical protein
MNNAVPLLDADRKVQFGCYAHIPGTGPAGEVCSHCALLVPDRSKFVCGKYQRLAGRKGKPISPNSSACKHFEMRKRFNAMPEV